MIRKLPRVTASLQVKGGRFYIVTRVPDGTGKTHQKWFSTGLPVKGNKRRAQRMLDEKVIELQAEYERSYRQAGWSVQDVADVPFVDVVDRWMARKRKTLAPYTVNGYMNIISRLRPYFQHLGLTTGEISPAVLEAYLEHLTDAGLSANTVAHHLTLIKSVFNDEIRAGAPLLNPARCVKPPKLEPFEAAAYSIEQVHALFRLFEGDPLKDIVREMQREELRRTLGGLAFARDRSGCGPLLPELTLQDRDAIYTLERVQGLPVLVEVNRDPVQRELTNVMQRANCELIATGLARHPLRTLPLLTGTALPAGNVILTLD